MLPPPYLPEEDALAAFGVRMANAFSLTGRKPRRMVALMAIMSFSASESGLLSPIVTDWSVASRSVSYWIWSRMPTMA